ncbi:MAG: zinc finger domain-containing protein [Candidatus Diapherotrites archaeon]
MKKCSSCNKVVVSEYVEFKCPKCLNAKIIRCTTCRSSSKPYTCPECGFSGP